METDMSSGNGKKESSASTLLDSLSDELVRHILSWLTPLELLQSVYLVSKRFARQLLHDGGDAGDDDENVSSSSSIWRTSMAVPRNEITQRFTLHQLQRYCMFETARKESNSINNNKASNIETKDSDFVAKVPAFLKYGSMLVFKSQALSLQANRVCLASTTDHLLNEGLENVLPENGEDDETERFYTIVSPPRQQQLLERFIHQRGPQNRNHGLHLVRVSHPNPATAPRWWSSRPMPSQEGRQERLLFTLRYPECLISEVWIKPLRDPFVRM
jgi:hypothetical protein